MSESVCMSVSLCECVRVSLWSRVSLCESESV